MTFEELLVTRAAEAELTLTAEQAGKFQLYLETLLDWNTRMNLTAITEPEEVAVKHFIDSLLLLRYLEVPKGAKVADIGTGAGFPSVPLALARPDLHLTLADSLNKRVGFLTELCALLGVDAHCVHGRAEDLAHRPELRERHDVVTARAVARLRELSEYCLPFVKVGGCFAALKGPELTEELGEAKPAIRLLGGELRAVNEYSLPDGGRRTLVLIEKISQTATKYPRSPGKIAKSPLK